MDRNVRQQGTIQLPPGREQRIRETIFKEYPEIGNYINKKEWLGYFLMIIGVAVFILRAVAGIITTEEIPIDVIAGAFAGYGICFVVLACCCMAVRIKAINISPVIAGIYFLYNIAKNYVNMQEVSAGLGKGILQVYQTVFRDSPLRAISDLLFAVYILTVFITSLVISLTPKFRRFMIQYEEILHVLMEKELEEENSSDKY